MVQWSQMTFPGMRPFGILPMTTVYLRTITEGRWALHVFNF
jgi:hypothetical protein